MLWDMLRERRGGANSMARLFGPSTKCKNDALFFVVISQTLENGQTRKIDCKISHSVGIMRLKTP
jgi:hypothetical protein